MRYAVKEIFFTLQGEGAQAGRPAVFCRFSGCNLWSGREEDRPSAICSFCDTDFVGTDGQGGGKFDSPERLADSILSNWPSIQKNRPGKERPFVVFTGGEPLLQLDAPLIDALHRHSFEIAVESNGTVLPPKGIDWLCISPKANAELVARAGHELKLVFPQEGAEPHLYEHLDFGRFYLQPMDGLLRERNKRLAVQYCLEHPQWRLSLQVHKVLGLP